MADTELKVDKSVVIRTIVLAVALINQLLTATGHSPLPIDDETINQLVSSVFTIVAAIWTFWKNNSFTKNAIKADAYKKTLEHKN